MFYALAGVPGVLVLCAAVAVALGVGSPKASSPSLTALSDVGAVRGFLLTVAPVGMPADIALVKLREQGLTCGTFEPPLANLTWRVIACSTAPSPSGAMLAIDVAGRNGVVADIGVEDLVCASRADVTDPAPEPGGCDLSGRRLLGVEASRRAAGTALLSEVLSPQASESNGTRR